MKESNHSVPALARGLKMLEMFNGKRRIISIQEFAEEQGISTSSTYRIVQTFMEMGYLKKIARSAYELGPQVISNGFSYLASRDVVDIAAPHITALRDATSLSCHLAILDGREIIYIYRALASQRLSVNVPIGMRLPCHITALGRALLSGLDDDEISHRYRNAQLDSYPRPHPQNLPELKRRISEERLQGYAISHSDNATAIAAPLYNHADEIVAAVNISGPEVAQDGEHVDVDICNQLLQTARQISSELGYLKSHMA